ncbi:MAG: glycoside hydrolase family 130 protein [Phycisphaerae bacterium]|nr:glycoside hydrolase family 130 protein [Phycisphaerae bacterium]
MANTIIGDNLANIPWQDKPAGCKDVCWRYDNNPVIARNHLPMSNSIFNSALVPFGDGFAGVFRVDSKCREAFIHVGFSKDGINFDISEERIEFNCDIEEVAPMIEGYDPRVCKIDDKYYVTWCNFYHGPTIGIAWTTDFKTFHQSENAFVPCNRNGVMFPRKINGNFAMLSRPSDQGHTTFGDIFYSESPDMTFWGKHRFVMGTQGGWQSKKIGAGPIPIETSEGWLLIYHGVQYSCNGFVYSMGAALLDIDEPWKVIARGKPYILSPQRDYECMGDVPNVTFPCAALTDAATGRIAIYYGCADTCTSIAFCQVDELIDYIKTNSKV